MANECRSEWQLAGFGTPDHGVVKRPLNDGLVQMMSAALAGDPIDVTACGRENPLPGP